MKIYDSGRNSLSRRELLQLGTIAATGAMVQNAASEEPKSGWIDAHVHVWTDNVKQYPLDKGFSVAAMQPPRFTPDDLFAHTVPAGVDRIVLIQMSYYQYDNAYMLDVIERYPGKFSGVGIVDYDAPDVGETMKQLADRGVRGFRITTLGPKTSTWVDHSGMATLWKRAAKEGLAVCPLINPADIPTIDQLCEKFPETTVVVDHFARVSVDSIRQEELNALCNLARHPRVYVKISAFYAVGGEPPYDSALPMLRRVFDAFGPKRLMWASDCPFQLRAPHSYETGLAIVRDRWEGLSQDDRNWLLRGAAEKVFFS